MRGGLGSGTYPYPGISLVDSLSVTLYGDLVGSHDYR
jgi:hypothetical protein